MKLKILPDQLTVCKLPDTEHIDLADEFCFVGKTDEEISLVCRTGRTPGNAVAREDGWRAFRVEGTLDFCMIGVLAGISSVLAENGISVFVISTYNTDYILVKEENCDRAAAALAASGYLTDGGPD